MGEGWTTETIERFEAALAHLAADNGKALKLSMMLSQAATLEEKQQTLEAWRSLAAHIVSDDGVTAAPQDLPHWFGLAALFDEWIRREGVPPLKARDAPGN